jgi:ABC-type dipeptide/oligopeptide/nickel transport system permease subunit
MICFKWLVRTYTLSLIEAPYVEASRALGSSVTHIAVRHLVPNMISIMLGSILVGTRAAILLESGLSFLGLSDLERVSSGTIPFYAQEINSTNIGSILASSVPRPTHNANNTGTNTHNTSNRKKPQSKRVELKFTVLLLSN